MFRTSTAQYGFPNMLDVQHHNTKTTPFTNWTTDTINGMVFTVCWCMKSRYFLHINNQHKSLIPVSSNSLLSLTSQLTATASSRAAFMQCLRWGIWCPFHESNDWNGEELQLRLQGGPKSNPHGLMVYSTQTSAKPQYSLLSTPEVAQVLQPHIKSVCSRNQM